MTAAIALPGTKWSGTHHITPGLLDEQARRAFCQGQCHALAYALEASRGWDVVWAGRDDCFYDPDCPPENIHGTAGPGWPDGVCGCELDHILVALPDGRYLDVDGPHSTDDLTNDPNGPRYETIEPLTLPLRAWMDRSPDWRRPNVAVAATFIEPLLDAHGLHRPTP